MSMTFNGLGYARYEWRASGQLQGSQTVLSLGLSLGFGITVRTV